MAPARSREVAIATLGRIFRLYNLISYVQESVLYDNLQLECAQNRPIS
jgi:hypothetical protein